jgi:GTPase KRas protein
MQHIKLVILGVGGVGKTAVTIQFLENHFIESYDPTIEDYYRKQINLDNKSYFVDILDTAGQEEYSAMRNFYYKSGNGFIIVYDITNRKSFYEVSEIRDQILRYRENNVPITICGNKSDMYLQREVLTSEGRELAEKFKCNFFETSAKSHTNVDQVWHDMIRQIVCPKQTKKLDKKHCSIL